MTDRTITSSAIDSTIGADTWSTATMFVLSLVLVIVVAWSLSHAPRSWNYFPTVCVVAVGTGVAFIVGVG